ncbi:MAG: hypothetical protein ACW9XA_03870 [Candidatus Nitrosopumilus sp. bin_6a]
MKVGIIIGIVVIIVIIGVASAYMSNLNDTSTDDIELPETDSEPKGTNYSIELTESMVMEQVP